jgi:hypothetical protein
MILLSTRKFQDGRPSGRPRWWAAIPTKLSYPLLYLFPFRHRIFLKKNSHGALIGPRPRLPPAFLSAATPGHILRCSAPRAMPLSTSPIAEGEEMEAYACAPIQRARWQEGEAYALRLGYTLDRCS